MRALCAVLICTLAPLASSAPAPDYAAEGMKALNESRFDAAAAAFSKAVEADPKDYAAQFHLALSYTFLQKDGEAIAAYRKTLELKPGLYEAELNCGILLLKQKDAEAAAALLRNAAGQKPKELRPRLYLAQALLAQGDNAQAEAQFKEAAALDSKSAAAELGLAQAQARQDRLDEAAPHFRQAAQLDASFKDALLELAELYEKARHPDEAIAIYQQFPGNAAAQERMGALLLETRKYGEAIPQLEQAYQQSPTPANRAALAAAYLFNHDFEHALPLLEKSVTEEPQNFDLRMMYARALRDRKQFPAAAKQFSEALRLKPDSRECWNDFAGMLYMLGNFEQSLAAFDKAKQLGEDTPANWYFRAIIQDKLQDLKPALESYQHFLSISQGKYPDEEFKARQRARIIQKELTKR
jgi:Tfp pilus assembly protein PilF